MAGQRPTRREELRSATVQDIKAAALRQVREAGAAQLSLRQVAADLRMSPAGLYRYYAGREELLTALLTDGFDDLADALEAARDADPGADLGDRLQAAVLAYRQWAVDRPREFALLYGDPVPGYAAPVGGPTAVAAQRVGAVFFGLLAETWRHGRLRVPDDVERRAAADPGLRAAAARFGPDLPSGAVAVIVGAWARMHGMVCLEVFGHLAWLSADGARLFAADTLASIAELGLRPATVGTDATG